MRTLFTLSLAVTSSDAQHESFFGAEGDRQPLLTTLLGQPRVELRGERRRGRDGASAQRRRDPRPPLVDAVTFHRRITFPTERRAASLPKAEKRPASPRSRSCSYRRHDGGAPGLFRRPGHGYWPPRRAQPFASRRATILLLSESAGSERFAACANVRGMGTLRRARGSFFWLLLRQRRGLWLFRHQTKTNVAATCQRSCAQRSPDAQSDCRLAAEPVATAPGEQFQAERARAEEAISPRARLPEHGHHPVRDVGQCSAPGSFSCKQR